MTMHQRTWRTALLIALGCGSGLLAQSPSLTYPQPRKGDVVDDYFGTKVADPYRWMEDLNAPEVKQWVDAENAVTSKYLDALPQRDALKKRITELWNYPRVTPPRYEGRHWFYSRNSGLQRQSVVFTRETLTDPETVALDPNSLSPDGSVALSGFVPAPDGQHFAYGQSEGGSDWSTYYIRELGTGKQLPDVIRWVKFSSLSWTEDGKGFFYGRYPEPRAGKALEDAVRDKKIYYHALGTQQSADRLIYERPDEPTLFIDADTGRDRPVSLLLHEQGHEQQERAVREGPRRPACAEARRAGPAAVSRPHGGVRPARRRRRHDVSADRSRRAEQEGRRGADRSARCRRTGRRSSPRAGTPSIRRGWSRASWPSTRWSTWRARCRFYNLDGSPAGQITPPGLGTISGSVGRFDRPEIFYTFTSPLYPTTVFRFDLATGRSTPFEPPKLTFDPTLYTTERVFATSKDGTRVPMFITHRKDLKKDGIEPDDAVWLRRIRHLRGCRASGPTAGVARAGRRVGDGEHARRRRIRRGVARSRHVREEAERLRRLHRRGRISGEGALRVAADARHHGRIERRPAGRRGASSSGPTCSPSRCRRSA